MVFDGMLGVELQGSMMCIRGKIEGALEWEKRKGNSESEREFLEKKMIERKKERHPQCTTGSKSPFQRTSNRLVH